MSTFPEAKRTLRLFDVTGIIVGIIIGSAIYKTPSEVAGLLGTGGWILFAWIMGGALSLLGALCYAELASAYPREGGDYFFLRHTYGPWAGFLFAWGRIWVIHSGSIAMMAYIAGEYGEQLFSFNHLTGHLAWFPQTRTVYSLLVVVVFTGVNCLGLRQGKWTQNLLATAQVLGLTGIIVVAFALPAAAPAPAAAAPDAGGLTWGAFFLAMVLVQLAYGGWSDCAFVASEIKNPGKNVFRALLLGIAIVTAVYCLVNGALLRALGPAAMAQQAELDSTAVTQTGGIMAQVVDQGLGSMGAKIISLLVIVCALGSVNGMILVGSRIYHAFGRDHAAFRFLGQSRGASSVPLAAFLLQGVISCVLILWGNFGDLVIYTAAAHWLFMTLIGLALLILRVREPAVDRPYKVPLYPVIPLLYIATCGLLLYSSFNYGNFYTPYGAWLGFGLVMTGLPVYWITQRISRTPGPEPRVDGNG